MRSVPLIPDLVEPLRELRKREHFVADDDLVFVSDTGTHVESFALRRRFYRDLDLAGLDRLRFHDLRHTFGSLAVQVFPLPDVMAMMGHAHISTTMRYVHHTPGADDAARLSGALRANATTSRHHWTHAETHDAAAISLPRGAVLFVVSWRRGRLRLHGSFQLDRAPQRGQQEGARVRYALRAEPDTGSRLIWDLELPKEFLDRQWFTGRGRPEPDHRAFHGIRELRPRVAVSLNEQLAASGGVPRT